MDHPICEQGDSDAHQILRLACEQLGRPQKRNRLQWSRRTLSDLQQTLGWKWQRFHHALQDLEDDTAGQVVAPDDKGVLAVPEGLECRCGTRAPSSVLDTASSGGSSYASAGTAARSVPRPPSPSSPSSLPSAADSGRRSSPDGPPQRRSGEGSDDHAQDEAPSKVAGRRIVKRRRGDIDDATGDRARRLRQARRERRLKPVEDWNARDLTSAFIDTVEARFVEFGDFGKRRNPRRPLEKFYADARREGVSSTVLWAVTEEYIHGYDLDGPPWRPFIAIAPELIDSRLRRERQYGTSRERVAKDELTTRYGSRRRGDDPW